MKKINITNTGVSELNTEEARNINGGILPLVIGIIILSFSLGYGDGRRDKK